MYWTLTMHKELIGARFVSSKDGGTKLISKVVSKAFKLPSNTKFL